MTSTPPPAASSARAPLRAGGVTATIYRLDAVAERLDRLPFTVKVLLENVLRRSASADAGDPSASARSGRGSWKRPSAAWTL